MSNRKAAEQFIIKYINAILPGSDNTTIYHLHAYRDDLKYIIRIDLLGIP